MIESYYVSACLMCAAVALFVLWLFTTPDPTDAEWEKFTPPAKVIQLRPARQRGLDSAEIAKAIRDSINADPQLEAKVLRLKARREATEPTEPTEPMDL